MGIFEIMAITGSITGVAGTTFGVINTVSIHKIKKVQEADKCQLQELWNLVHPQPIVPVPAPVAGAVNG